MSNLTCLDPFDDLFCGFFVRPVEMGNSTPSQAPASDDVRENPEPFCARRTAGRGRREDIHVTHRRQPRPDQRRGQAGEGS